MTTQLHRPTAKIYAFPSGGRPPPNRYHDTSKPSAYAAPAHIEHAARVQHGTSWYHEEAIEEAEETCGR